MGYLAVGSNNINVYACVTLSSTTLLTLLTFILRDIRLFPLTLYYIPILSLWFNPFDTQN